MAQAFIINDDYGTLVKNYYDRFPEEPISAKTILPVTSPTTMQMSMDTLLSAIIKALAAKDASKDIVIVSHGNKNGMLMGLYPNAPKLSITDNLQILLGSDTSAKKADQLGMKLSFVDGLLAKADQVRKLGLGHVAFRGCTIGENQRNLSTLKDWLGATTVSGTNLLSTYGPGLAKYEKNKKKFDDLVKRFDKTGNIYTGGASRVILATSPGKEAYTEIIYFYLESEDGMLDWLQTHISTAATKATAAAVKLNTPLHYLSGKPPVTPLDGVSKKGGVAVGYADYIRDTDTP